MPLKSKYCWLETLAEGPKKVKLWGKETNQTKQQQQQKVRTTFRYNKHIRNSLLPEALAKSQED